jgi:predicted DsbA family dithiol-disulfide isomerase
MRIDIWSDVVCPWCYLGKRRLEQALAGFEHRAEVEVVWHSFQLDPSAVTSDEPTADRLAAKLGTDRAGVRAMHDRMAALAAEVGLDFHFEGTTATNTFDAHRLLHLAAEHGRQGELKERLLRGYFTDGERVGDHETLVRLAVEVGLPEAVVRELLAGDDRADQVHADLAQARAYGISGVPFFVLDARYGISGAQPTEVFSQALDQAWADTHPESTLLPVGADGPACVDDSCAL